MGSMKAKAMPPITKDIAAKAKAHPQIKQINSAFNNDCLAY